ncbi:MAG: hypothetical protein ACU836_08080 [Gammaproteobacteria bacterium]
MDEYFSSHKDVFHYQFENEFLAYSALSGETVVLSDFAAKILLSLLSESRSFSGLLADAKNESVQSADIEASLQDVIKELTGRGFIYRQLPHSGE